MIKAVNRLAVLVLLAVLTSPGVFAETIKREVTFLNPVVVNGTEVKKGTYVAAFDDQTNELTISKGKKVIARAPARLEKQDERSNINFIFREEAGQRVLVTIALKNRNQATLYNGESKAASAK